MNTTAITRLRLVVWSVLLFIGVIVVHTRHNDFPWYYHPDEPGKVEQVLGMRSWNFHHPMLLLSTTKVVAKAQGLTKPQQVVEAGRTVSAVFTALGIAALSLLAYQWRGWPAGIAAGLALLCHHQLFELSHYMKEDTAFFFGMAVVFLAANMHAREPSLAAALLLGAGCGFAISGKYLGVMALPIAVPVLIRNRRQGSTTAAIAAFVVVFVTVNLPLLQDWQTFWKSFARETKLVVEGQGQLTQKVPHARYWSVFLANTTPVTWILLAFLLWSFCRRPGQFTFAQRLTLAFPFAYAIALSFSPKDNDRYFLPASALFTMLAACAVIDLGQLTLRRNARHALEIAGGLALILAQFPDWTDDRGGLLRYDQAFQRDDTSEMVAWLRGNVPPSSVIAIDEKVRLPTKERHGSGPGAEPLPHRILTDNYVADIPRQHGTIEELREMGVTHVVITPSTYQRFERAGFQPKENAAADYERRKLFYAFLRRDYEPLRVWQRGTVIYLHPGLEVYRITGDLAPAR